MNERGFGSAQPSFKLYRSLSEAEVTGNELEFQEAVISATLNHLFVIRRLSSLSVVEGNSNSPNSGFDSAQPTIMNNKTNNIYMQAVKKEPTKTSVPEGYKRTEVGVIPEDWEVTTLQNCVDFLDGNRKPVKKSDREKMKGHYPYYGASGIIDYVNDYLYDEELILLAEDGENILSRNSRIAFKINGKTWVNNHAHVLRPKPHFDLIFLTEYLESIDYEEHNSGTAQPKLNKKTCEKILVLEPPFQEQCAIAEALSDVDALIAELDVLIEKKQQVKKGAMQQLITGKKRLPGFSGAWEEKKLGEIGNTYNGLSGKTKANFGNGNHPYIPFLNIMNNPVINTNNFDTVEIKSGENQSTAEKGDLFFNTSSETPEEVGMCSVLLDEVENLHLNSFCFGFRLFDQDEIVPLFLAYYFRSQYGRECMESLAQGSTRYNLSKSKFIKIKLALPSYKEQKAIAQILSDMNAEIQSLQQKKAKYQKIKQGMMQELLTGKTRFGGA